MMLSASNMPVPYESHDDPPGHVRTTVLLLPAFKIIEHVTPQSVPDLITHYVNNAPTNTTPLSISQTSDGAIHGASASASVPSVPDSLPSGLTAKPCPHQYLVLLCSHATRDARCGQSAPLLKREFERHLRPLGMYRDLDDERPGGVGIYFINHVGGHKFSANMMVYRRGGSGSGSAGEKAAAKANGTPGEEAAQCIWLARVRPEDVENIVRYTILQGKVVKPERQLRGGFDRARQLVSW